MGELKCRWKFPASRIFFWLSPAALPGSPLAEWGRCQLANSWRRGWGHLENIQLNIIDKCFIEVAAQHHDTFFYIRIIMLIL